LYNNTDDTSSKNVVISNTNGDDTASTPSNFIMHMNEHSSSIEVEQLYKRPHMHEMLLQRYAACKNVGILTCGPVSMQQEVKEYVTLHNNNHVVGDKIVLYEDFFEI